MFKCKNHSLALGGRGRKCHPETLSRICNVHSSSRTNSALSQRERAKDDKNFVPVCLNALVPIKKKAAFTLAEVLITLGIIGVVAAMAIPILSNNIRLITTKNKYKKHVAELNQAVMMAKATEDIDFVNATSATTSIRTDGSLNGCKTATLKDYSFCGIFNEELKNILFVGYNGDNVENVFQYRFASRGTKTLNLTNLFWLWQFPDGTIFGIHGSHNIFGHRNCTLESGEEVNPEWGAQHYGCFGFIDVNGMAPPNKEVTCSDGTITSNTPKKPCVVSGKNLTDIIPIVMHDSSVEPATNAAAYLFQN